MTRARALKQVIRERAAKTGERYTTARRHVLDDGRAARGRARAARPPCSRRPPRQRQRVGREGDREDRPRSRSLVRRARSLRRRREGTHRRGAAPLRDSRRARLVRAGHHRGLRARARRARAQPALRRRVRGVGVEGDRRRRPPEVDQGVHRRAGCASAGSADVDPTLAARADGRGRPARRPRDSWCAPTARPASATSGTARSCSSTCIRNPAARCRSSSSTPSLPGAEAVEERRAQWKAAFGAIAEAV